MALTIATGQAIAASTRIVPAAADVIAAAIIGTPAVTAIRVCTTATDRSPQSCIDSTADQFPAAIPSGFQIARHFQDVIECWHTNQPKLDWEAALSKLGTDLASLEGQIEHLGLRNCFQWHLEDECRANYASQEILAQLKCSIDLCNQRRVCVIDAVDDQLVRRLRYSGPELPPARLALMTPANLMDRLSILELKRYHAQRIDSQKTATKTQMTALLEKRIQDLRAGMDELAQDLFAGRERLKVYRTVKLYGIGL